ADLAVVGERQRGGPPLNAGAGGGGGNIGEGRGEGERAPRRELTALIVGSEDDEASAVGDGEIDGHRPGGIEERTVEGGGHPEDPVAGAGAAGAPDARSGGPITVEAQGGDGAAARGAQGGGKGPVGGAIGAKGALALPDAIADLAVVGERKRGGARIGCHDREPCRHRRGAAARVRHRDVSWAQRGSASDRERNSELRRGGDRHITCRHARPTQRDRRAGREPAPRDRHLDGCSRRSLVGRRRGDRYGWHRHGESPCQRPTATIWIRYRQISAPGGSPGRNG